MKTRARVLRAALSAAPPAALCIFTAAAFLVLLAAPRLAARAQSGRAAPTPPQTSAPAPRPSPSGTPDARPVFPAGADPYRLVFPTGYEGKRFYRLDKERAALARATRSEVDEFVRQLNLAGGQGYRLASTVHHGFAVGLAVLDEARYEYEWFETTSELFFAAGPFEQRYGEPSRRGFRLADQALLERHCEPLNPDNSAHGEWCQFRHMFLLVRERGAARPVRHALVGSVPGWGRDPAAEMSARLKETLADGFHPTGALSRSQILVEHAADADARADDRPDVRVVTSSWGGDVRKKIDELAKQGYRLGLVNHGVAVMYRRRGGAAAAPVTYAWLRTKDKGFAKRLAELQEAGAVYRTTYPGEDGAEDRLIFERQPGGGRPGREYRVLGLEFEFVEDAARGRVRIGLAPASEETMRAVNKLAREGFAVRDLFVADKVCLLLERAP